MIELVGWLYYSDGVQGEGIQYQLVGNMPYLHSSRYHDPTP